jgi:tripartite-type tricarboxylate transporter receptor subunit TctC
MTNVKLPRRTFLHLAAGAAALPAIPGIAGAQAYPSRPVRIIVGAVAGGPTDFHARLIGRWLSERLGQPFVVENRPGGGSNLATEAVVRAAPDGYTLLLCATQHAINATLYAGLNFNFVRDIAPVAGIIRGASVMAVHPSSPVKTVSQLVAHAYANPGKINMASAGNGASSHMAGEMFKMITGLNIVHVPSRGEAPALTDLLGGQVDLMFPTLTTSLEHVRTGKLRALGVSTTTRSEALPDIPPISDTVRGYEASTWAGVGAPKSTPTEIIDRLNREINAALASATIRVRYADLGGTPIAGSPAEFAKFIADDTEKWAKVIKFAGIKPE